METFEEIIIAAGGRIDVAPAGKVWVTYPNGKPISRGTRAKVMVKLGVLYVAGESLEACAFHLYKKNLLDLNPCGFDKCIRCGGSGRMPYAAHGGICYKCVGKGAVKMK